MSQQFVAAAERQQLTDRLRRSEARLAESERVAGLGSWEFVPQTGELTYSPGLLHLAGLPPDTLLTEADLARLVHPEDRAAVAAAIAECASAGLARCEFRLRRRDGSVRTLTTQGEAVPGRAGEPLYLRGAVLDVTEQREGERERMAAASLLQEGFDASPIGMAITDAHTGHCVRTNDAMCALMGCSRENLLQRRVDDVTHPDDRADVLVARQALLDGTLASHHAERRLLRQDGTTIWASVHVAAVRGADRTVHAFFSQVIDITERIANAAQFDTEVSDAVWLGRIRHALDHDGFVLYGQPIVDLMTGETMQQELLIRMLAEDGSVIAPGEFLPVAERYGLISEIDRWVIRRAVDLAATGRPTEFNLSGASLDDPDVLRELTQALQETGADPSLLVAEVTETAMMNHPDAGSAFAKQVTDLGCQLALDDFGTGFASLSYLKQIPAENLKIDIEFVRDLTRDKTDERLIRGIVGFAREFHQTTTAEGIEDHATLVRLRELGVHQGQGYLFGRPEPLPDGGAATGHPGVERSAGPHPGEIVRAAFAAFARRDVLALELGCHPEVVIRMFATSQLAERDGPYHGYAGLRAYMKDVAVVWKHLTLTPTVFREVGDTVIVFGRAEGDAGSEIQALNVLWVWQLADGLVTSVEVFQQPALDLGAQRRGGTDRRDAAALTQPR